MRKRVKWRVNPWFPVICYGFCPDAETWEVERARALRKGHVEIGDYPVNDLHLGMTNNFRSDTLDAHCLLSLSPKLDSDPIKLVCLIAHECVHIAEAMFEEMREASPSEEFRAYVVGALVAEMFEDYSATRGKKD
jgi:hypothetical protein